jgi:TonB family protein
MPDSNSSLQVPADRARIAQNGANGRSATSGGSLGDALRNLQRYTQNESFNNQDGGGGQFGPEIQFDTKGVEFGPWIRRFIAQVKRNWFIPYAAMSMKGHVVIQFNVHKDGSITDLQVVGPSGVDAFNNAAFGALSGSNPTQPLPPEYPDSKAFFTVTFFYNETPPR